MPLSPRSSARQLGAISQRRERPKLVEKKHGAGIERANDVLRGPASGRWILCRRTERERHVGCLESRHLYTVSTLCLDTFLNRGVVVCFVCCFSLLFLAFRCFVRSVPAGICPQKLAAWPAQLEARHAMPCHAMLGACCVEVEVARRQREPRRPRSYDAGPTSHGHCLATASAVYTISIYLYLSL